MKNNVGLHTLKPLTAAQKREIRKLPQVVPDDQIDYSDIAPIPESWFKQAARNRLYRPVKRQVTVRLDADVIEWLRGKGKGYQTRINNLLRAAMLQELKPVKRR